MIIFESEFYIKFYKKIEDRIDFKYKNARVNAGQGDK